MRKLMDWLYPKYDEVSVFLITLIIVTSIVADDAARMVVGVLFMELFGVSPVVTTAIAFGVLLIVGSALMLPLTRSDLRQFAFIMIVVHTIVVAAANVVWAITDKGDPRWHSLNWIFVFYSLSWLVVLRYRPAIDVISDRQAHPREALYAGALCVLLVIVVTDVLGIPWLYAYSLAFVGISTLHDLGLTAIQAINARTAR